MIPAIAALAMAGGAVAQTVEAPEPDFPTVSGSFQTRIQSDYTYKSKDRKQKLSDTFTKTEFGVDVGFTEEFSLRSQIKLEPVKAPDGDRFFGDHGLWLEQLYANYETEDFSIFAGKFHPKFSFAYDKAPYIYGRDFVEDYEMTEKIGVGGSIKVAPEGWGEHALTGAAYFQDSTALSNSAFSRPRFDDPRTDRPGRLRKRNGGVGNTGALDSFVVSLDGAKMPFAAGLEYTLGYRFQKHGATEAFDEKGFTAGLAYAIGITDELKVTPMVEYATFRKFDGVDADARYITGGVLAEYGPWSLGTSYTSRRIKVREDDTTNDDRLFQVSLGYTFDFGLGLYVGWKTQKVEGVTSDSVGVMALYGFKF